VWLGRFSASRFRFGVRDESWRWAGREGKGAETDGEGVVWPGGYTW